MMSWCAFRVPGRTATISRTTKGTVTGWIDRIENPEAVRSLFPDATGIEHLDVHEMTLHRDGPSLRIRADLLRFPDKPPARWPVGANRAQVTIALHAVRDLSIDGVATNMHGVFDLVHESDALRFELRASGFHLRGTCGMARLDSITGYVDGG